jgi:hypothetical protein
MHKKGVYMGFLNNILKSVKREVEYDASRKAANTISNSISNLFNKKPGDNAGNTQPAAPSNTTPAPSTDRYQGFVIGGNNQNSYQPADAAINDDGTVIIDGIDYSQNYNCDLNHFRTILKESFPDMDIREDVPLNEIIPGLNGAYQSVSFLLSQGSSKIVIQIRYPHQSTRVGSQRVCRQNGIGYISLWTDYKNQKEYIEKRVKDALWN